MGLWFYHEEVRTTAGILERMLHALCSAARPGYDKAMGTCCLGSSCRAGLVNSSHECRTGQVSRAVSHTSGFPGLTSDVDWRLYKSSVSKPCSQSPSVACWLLCHSPQGISPWDA